ncbi:winged helix-turn-helix domain-containing protein [Emticicia fluvialis]|uniref:winged helix-turn-helix domain-containing protein n=1 Tax=Emticicia fluvialis TaxID=2974474 RepID=UPI0021663E39|nr:LysR family transcriptional regulator [Emticicia fluvialis]
MQELLSGEKDIKVAGSIWIERADGSERYLGKGRIQLMELIIAHGSISKAAQAMQMSYKRAWDLITSMNTQSEKPLVATQVGGKQGGGAIVTDEGHRAIEAYKALQQRFEAFMRQETQKLSE